MLSVSFRSAEAPRAIRLGRSSTPWTAAQVRTPRTTATSDANKRRLKSPAGEDTFKGLHPETDGQKVPGTKHWPSPAQERGGILPNLWAYLKQFKADGQQKVAGFYKKLIGLVARGNFLRRSGVIAD